MPDDNFETHQPVNVEELSFIDVVREEFLSRDGLKFLGGSVICFTPFFAAVGVIAGKEAVAVSVGGGLLAGIGALAVGYRVFNNANIH